MGPFRLFGKKMTVNKPPEIWDIPWSSGMPVIVRLGGEIVPLRIRGSCSIQICDAGLFKDKIGDTADLAPQTRLVLARKASDLLGEVSRSKSSFEELLSLLRTLEVQLKARSEPEFGGVGLVIQRVVIQAIEKA
jgi:hypothetical protein